MLKKSFVKIFNWHKLSGLIVSMVLYSGSSWADHTLVINTASQPPMINSTNSGFLNELTKEIFKRIGHEVEFIILNANARTLQNVDEGIDDGNLVRISGIEKQFKNLRMMPESMTLFEFAVFTKQPEIEIGNWEDLGQYNVAFIRGWKILENNVTQAQSINLVKNADQLFDLLDSNRTEIAIFGPLRGRYLIKEKGMQDIRVLEPPLASRKVFLYLNKKHEALIPEMSAALKAMKADGTYEAILRKTVTPYVSESEVKRMLLN